MDCSLLQMALFCSFLWPNSIPLYTLYIQYLVYRFVSGHLGCFPVLASVNSAAMNSRVHVSFPIEVSFNRWIDVQEWDCRIMW